MPSQDYRGRPLAFKEVKALSLQTILAKYDYYDLCHIDVQGAECDVVAGGQDVLNRKVRRVVVGTHSRSIEGKLIDALSRNGWLLELEKPCIFNHPTSAIAIDESQTTRDGTQVWLNSRLVSR